MKSNRDIQDAVGTFRMRLKDLIESQAKMAVAIYDQTKSPGIMNIFVMFCIANADQKSRDLLLDIFTHPSITPYHTQYILGQRQWTTEMFDELTKLNFDATNQFVTTYIGVALDYLYCGSATSLVPRGRRMGESRRMKQHFMTLQRGQEEIVRRRREGDHACLYIHEKMGFSDGKWFFAPLFRFPVNADDPSRLDKSALAYFGENIGMMFLGTGKRDPMVRNSANRSLAELSRLISLKLRSKSLPTPPWKGSNLVLPMLQSARPMWNMLSGRVVEAVKPTPELIKSLQDRFQRTHQPWISSVTCDRILRHHDQNTGATNYETVRKLYSEVLDQHGLEYQNMHQKYLRQMSILYVAIIGQVEDAGVATFNEDTQRYKFSVDDLDWDDVSARAQALVSDDEKSDFGTARCRSISDDYNHIYFHQQILNKPNWETLRGKLV